MPDSQSQGLLCSSSQSSTFQCHWLPTHSNGEGLCVASASCGCPGKTDYVGNIAQTLGTTSSAQVCFDELCSEFRDRVSGLGILTETVPSPNGSQGVKLKLNPYCSNYSNVQDVLNARMVSCGQATEGGPCCKGGRYCASPEDCLDEGSLKSQVFCH